MRAGDIIAGIVRRLRCATRNRAEIDALDVERVTRGYRLAVEDDSTDAACRRVVRGCFLGAFEDHAEYSGHDVLLSFPEFSCPSPSKPRQWSINPGPTSS